PPTFSLSELQVLVQLAAGKTLRQTARELHVQEPAISRSLRSAEQRAGFALVERRGRRLYLTASGLELANKARDVTEQQQFDLLQMLGNVAGDRSAAARHAQQP